MSARELIAELQKFDPETPVVTTGRMASTCTILRLIANGSSIGSGRSGPAWEPRGGGGYSAMRNIVNEAGEIVAKATHDGTLVGGHHRIAVAASLGQKLVWQDTSEPVNLEAFFRHPASFHRHTA